MSRERHSWDKEKKLPYTVRQQCIKCGLYRFKVLGMWRYSKEANQEMFVESVENKGCIGSTQRNKIHKDKNHSHYFIEDGFFCESYYTIRGKRWRGLMKVELEDIDFCDKSILRYIESEYFN